MRHNNGKFGGLQALRQRSDTVPAWLYDSGYQTGYLGKYLNGYQHSREQGWTRWKPLVTAMVSRYTSYQFYGERKVTHGYVTHEIEKMTNETVREFSGTGKPFFMVVNHTAPHATMVGNDQHPPVPSRKYRNYPVSNKDLGYFLDKPSFNKRHLTDVPPSLDAPRVGDKEYIADAIGRIRALQSVDDAMESLVRHSSRAASWTGPTSSSPPTTATCSASTDSPGRPTGPRVPRRADRRPRARGEEGRREPEDRQPRRPAENIPRHRRGRLAAPGRWHGHHVPAPQPRRRLARHHPGADRRRQRLGAPRRTDPPVCTPWTSAATGTTTSSTGSTTPLSDAMSSAPTATRESSRSSAAGTTTWPTAVANCNRIFGADPSPQ